MEIKDGTKPRKTIKASKPKVKTGCRTCKYVTSRIRRIKCDEQKPHCQRCVSTGRKCDGYDTTPSSTKTSSNHSIIPHGFGTIPIRSGSFLTSLDLTLAESTSFDFFRTRTAREISGVFDPTLWDRLILQVSHQEPSILHAAIALGSMHRSFVTNGTITINMADDLTDQHQLLSLQQYTKSISLLKKRLNDPTDARLTESVLMNIALFVSLELLLGRQRNAIVHLKSGLKILSESQLRKRDQSQDSQISSLVHKPYSVEEYLVGFFVRLDVQSAIFGEQSPSITKLPQQNTMGHELLIRDSFSNLTEARNYMDTLTNAVFRLRAQYLNNVLFSTQNQMMDIKFETSLSESEKSASREELEHRLVDWSLAFDKFLREPRQLFGPRESKAVILLRINYSAISLLASVSLLRRETDYDGHLSHFQNIVDLSTDYLEEERPKLSKLSNATAPTFVIDMGIIGPLYLVGHKCRHPRLRREAVSLLRRSAMHREGMWDSTAAEFVTRIIAIEEAEAGVGGKATKAEDIPESARLYDVMLDKSQDQTSGVLIRGRFRSEVDGEWHIREKSFVL